MFGYDVWQLIREAATVSAQTKAQKVLWTWNKKNKTL